MRILIIHNYYQHRGGEDVVFEQEVDELKKQYDVQTLTFVNKKGLKGIIQYLLYPWNFLISKKILQYAYEFKPDVVHFHNIHYAIGPLAIRMLVKKKFKVFMTLHNFRLVCPSAILFVNQHLFTASIQEDFPWTAVKNKVLENSFLKTFITGFTYWLHKKLGTWKDLHKYIALTEFNKEIIIKSKIGIVTEDIIVKPNFVSVPKASDEITRQEHYLFIGRLSPEKGLDSVLSAFQKNGKKLRIAGIGPLAGELKEKFKFCTHIKWIGNLSKEDIFNELRTCKALIVPSLSYEGATPLTIIEGMSTKTPVIASKIGSIPSVIVPGKTGWLFIPNNSDSINETILDFEACAFKATIIENAHQYFLSTFTKEIVLHKLVAGYESVI